jgi:predicted RNA-binding protein associated with RNAse of E/G family
MASELRYFRKDGSLIGIYVNISTPVEFYENSIRYVDLGIDVVKDKEGNVKVIDEDKLEHYYNEGYINTRIYEKVLKIVEEEKERIIKIS